VTLCARGLRTADALRDGMGNFLEKRGRAGTHSKLCEDLRSLARREPHGENRRAPPRFAISVWVPLGDDRLIPMPRRTHREGKDHRTVP
jgi:hypothetical protein